MNDLLDRLDWDDDQLPVGLPQDYDIATAGPDVLSWTENTLIQPDGGNAGQPWRWRQTQARYVQWFYALDSEGRYVWRRGQVILPKGAGKSPMAAALGCAELAGPVRFVKWADDGTPMMAPYPSPAVKLSALSQDQAEDATMNLAVAMLSNPAAALAIPGLDAGLTRIRTRAGTLTSATARAPSKEGLRPSCVILDETHLWVSANGGIRLAETLRRGVAKTGGRSLETSNMWVAGAGSVAESTHDYAGAVRAGKHRGDGVLRWQPVANCADLGDHDQVMAALGSLYFDSPWVDQERFAAEIVDGGTHPADARRYFLNEAASADDAWIAPHEWASCLDRSKALEDGDTITLGFDGSRGKVRGNADATALVAVRVSDGHVQLMGCWQAREGETDWQVPELLVDAKVREAFDRYNVVGFYADPAGWQSYLGAWEAAYSRHLKVKASRDHPIYYWSNLANRMVQTLAAFEEAVSNGDLTHDGSYRLSEHVLNARRRVGRGSGIQIAKEFPDSPNKIDCAVAAALAWRARLDSVGVIKPKGTGRGRVIVLA